MHTRLDRVCSMQIGVRKASLIVRLDEIVTSKWRSIVLAKATLHAWVSHPAMQERLDAMHIPLSLKLLRGMDSAQMLYQTISAT